jgi:hypothetical protein
VIVDVALEHHITPDALLHERATHTGERKWLVGFYTKDGRMHDKAYCATGKLAALGEDEGKPDFFSSRYNVDVLICEI